MVLYLHLILLNGIGVTPVSFGKEEWSVVIDRDRVVGNTARDESVGVIIMVSFYLCLHPFLQFPSHAF